MALLKKLLIAAAVLLVLFFGNIFIFFYLNGQSVIIAKAGQMLHRPVTVVEVRLAFPLVLNIKGLNVEGLLWVDEAIVRCDLMTFAGRSFHLSEVRLVNPVLTLHRSRDNQIIWAEHYDGSHGSAAVKTEGAQPVAGKVNASIRSLIVENGRIHFPSHLSAEEPEVSFQDVRLTAKNVPLSGQSLDTQFNFSGMVEGDAPFAGDHLKGSGWINWPDRNMDAVFKVINPQGKLDVEVNLNAKHNDMTVRGRVKTRRVSLKADGSGNSSTEHMLLDAVQSAGMEMNLDFSFPVKMDRWELRNIDFSGSLNALDEGKTGPEQTEDLKNIGQQFKAVGEKIYEQYKPSSK